MTQPMEDAARTAITQCLEVREDEEVVVVTDAATRPIGAALRTASREAGADTTLMEIEETGSHGAEPARNVAAAMAAADVVVAPTRYSLSHTEARQHACSEGARVATMPGITEEVFTTALGADYEEVARKCRLLMSRLRSTEQVHVTSPSGTDITLDVRYNDWHPDTGLIHDSGAFGNLPAGEISGPPVHAKGTIVIDSEQFCPAGTEVEINHQSAVSISDQDCRLAEAFEEVEHGRNLAELGIGTNPAATIIGTILQDEKVMGTCHFAFGNDTSYGGNHDAEIHWDCIVEDPTIMFDDTVIMDEGEFVGLEI